MYDCWSDMDTQRAYNFKFAEDFNEFTEFEIAEFPFWVTVFDKKKEVKVGTLRLGADDKYPDLAIWVFPKYRNKKYGTKSFRLALQYLFEHTHFIEISAGCYSDNRYSKRMLLNIGFYHYPEGDVKEISCFTGETLIQEEYRITRDILDYYR